MAVTHTFDYWKSGIRLYLAIAIVLLSVGVVWWSSTVYGESTLAFIRAQQIFGWLSIGWLAAALLIGPLCAMRPRLPFKSLLFDARRLLGIGAGWFALLHAGIVYIKLFGMPNIFDLSDTYRLAFGLGILSLAVLLAMMFTSFDAALKKMGTWWFRLHRLVYAVVLMVLLHVFLIGTHATGGLALSLLTVAIAAIAGLHGYVVFTRRSASSFALAGYVVFLLAAMLTIAYGYDRASSERSVSVVSISAPELIS